MNKSCKFSLTIITSILILFVLGFAQESKQPTIPDSVRLKAQSNDNCMAITRFFQDSLIEANQPGGLIITNNSCSENIIFPELKPNELSLSQKLDLIAQKNSNYTWENEEGVINLRPLTSTPKLLNTQIKDLKITFDTNLYIVADTILRAPEIVNQLKELNLKEGMQFGGLQSPPSKRPSTEMNFHDKTLQEILNEIVRKRGRGVWLYQESNYNGANNFILNFIVQ